MLTGATPDELDRKIRTHWQETVIPGSHAALCAARDEQDQVQRLKQFRATHPDVVILLLGTCPKAWAGGQRIERPTLRGLLDRLEEIFHPDPQAGQAGGSP